MTISIRKTTLEDLPEVLIMIREFAAFENLSDACTVSEADLASALFGDGSFVDSLIARDGGTCAGYAIFNNSFSSFRGQRGLYLEDIYVRPQYRGSGVGRQLLSQIAGIGRSRGAVRIDFQVLDWNENAIKFYRGLGAIADQDERHYKFSDEAFERLCA